MQEKLPFKQSIFFFTIFIAGLCSIIYELLISTTSSYFLGDSVTQFSLVIGIYMAAMGLGSYLSKFITDKLLEWFIKIEIILGLIGGSSVPILYFVFDKLDATSYQIVMLSLTLLIGTLTGFEIPLLIRILKQHYPLKSNLAYVLSLDYVGALIATLLFPFLLLPFLGTFQTSIVFGLVNIILGLWIYRFFTKRLSIKKKRFLEIAAVSCIAFFVLVGINSSKLLTHWEDNFYTSRIIFAKQTPYQNLVLTKNQEDLRLYINRIIQFSSIDEYRYHESLGLIPLEAAPYKKNVLILGGGEGLLAREVLKHPKVESVTIVDLDEEVFRISKENKHLTALNENALNNPKVTLVVDDAMNFLKNNSQQYELILADLPDPSNESLARLYSTVFYKLVKTKLTPYGVFATQATSPFHTRSAFWCIHETLKASDFAEVQAFHAYVPSFGDWGFVIASDYPIKAQNFKTNIPCKYLEPALVEKMFYFEKDINKPNNISPNHINQPNLLAYFLNDWEKWRKEKKH